MYIWIIFYIFMVFYLFLALKKTFFAAALMRLRGAESFCGFWCYPFTFYTTKITVSNLLQHILRNKRKKRKKKRFSEVYVKFWFKKKGYYAGSPFFLVKNLCI